ncbi:MAG TPA: MFS transporter [Xanthobacteraceae bacterium]|nr:MFS transporter [Xanthobacteraceae bacterium]
MSASEAAVGGNGSIGDVVARIERLPISWWHIKARMIIGVATFFDAFDALAIAFVLPVLVRAWKLGGPQIGLLISAGYLGQLVGALFFGWIAERNGRIRAMIWSILIFAVMSLACAFAWDYRTLVAARIVQGFGLGGEVPVAAAYISELARAKGRGRFVLLYELVFPVGLVAAGFLGSWIVPRFGWQWMFVIGALPALVAMVLQRLLPESPRWLASRGRNAEAAAAIAEIERETEKSTGAPLPPPQPIAVAGPLKASWSDLFGPSYLRRTLVVWVIWFATYFFNYGLVVWLPTIYSTVFKLPLQQSLQYGLITQAVGFCGALLCALTIDYVGRRAWFTFAFAANAIALGALFVLGADSPQRVLVLVSCGFFFVSVLSIGVYVYTPELYPTRARAIAVGTATAWLRLASILGPAIVGFIVGSGLGAVFLVFAAVGVVGAIVTGLFAVETKRRILEEISP